MTKVKLSLARAGTCCSTLCSRGHGLSAEWKPLAREDSTIRSIRARSGNSRFHEICRVTPVLNRRAGGKIRSLTRIMIMGSYFEKNIQFIKRRFCVWIHSLHDKPNSYPFQTPLFANGIGYHVAPKDGRDMFMARSQAYRP